MAFATVLPGLLLSFMFCICGSSLPSNILIHPLTGAGSHYIVMENIAKELLTRGHSVTMLVSDTYEDKLRNQLRTPNNKISFIFYKSAISMNEKIGMLRNKTNAGMKGKQAEWVNYFFKPDWFKKQALDCRSLLHNDHIISKLQNFDLSLVDHDHRSCPIVPYLRYKFGVKFIEVSAVLSFPSIDMLGKRIPFYPSFMPELGSAFDHVMTFTERLINVATSALLTFTFILSRHYNPTYEAEFGIADSSRYYRYNNAAELALINTNFALDFPKPLPPNVIPVGGLTCQTTQPLTKEWMEIIKSAGEAGVVLFSMGSYATGIDDDKANLFAAAFAKLPQMVIWKLNGKPPTTVAPNIKLVDWVPQNDLLGHPQVKAFVYHCGMNGVWEAVYNAVPVIAVPLYSDQQDIAQRLVSRGMAEKLDISTMTSDELARAINTVISDPNYKTNATRISGIFRDSPRTPTQLAADWIEYMIRHNGAKHLRPAALDLNFFQYLLLDVFAVLLLTLITGLIMLYYNCRLCVKGCKIMVVTFRRSKRE